MERKPKLIDQVLAVAVRKYHTARDMVTTKVRYMIVRRRYGAYAGAVVESEQT